MRGVLILSILSAFMFVSCSTVSPVNEQVMINENITGSRVFLGYYNVQLDSASQSIEITSARSNEYHMNAESYLLGWPCGNCLKIQNLQLLPGNIVECDIEVTHPIALPQYTVFDLRVITIFKDDESFGDKSVSYALQNRDGLTTIWDNLSIPGDVNGYIAYNKGEPRRPFGPGDIFSEHFRIQLPDGPLQFDIGVDASWAPNNGVDFPIEMNSFEVIDLEGNVTGGLTDQGGLARISASMYDYQGVDSILVVTAASDDLFNSPVILDFESGDANSAIYSKLITNEKSAPVGSYNVLMRVVDKENLNYPQDISSYEVVACEVSSSIVEVDLFEDDDFKTPGNSYSYYSYAGPADHNTIDYFDTDGPWDFTDLDYLENAQKSILAPGDPEINNFASDFPDADHFVKNHGHFGLGSGIFYQPERHDYSRNELMPLGFYAEEYFDGAIVYDNTLEGFPYPLNISSSYSRSFRSGFLVYIDYDVSAVGMGPCIIPLNGETIENALMVRSIIDFEVGFPIFKTIIYEWFDDDGNLLAVVTSSNIAGREPLWIEGTNEIIYGGIMSLSNKNRQ